MLTKESAEKLLSPIHPLVFKAFQLAAEAYYRDIAPLYSSPYKRMRAGNISNLANEYLREHCAGIKGIRVIFEHERVLVCVDGQALVRFKKLTRLGLRSRNYPTQSSIAFEEQAQTQLLFAFMEPITNLTAGYVLDELTGMVSVFVTCPNGGGNQWEYEIEDVKRPTVMPSTNENEQRNLWRKRGEDKRAQDIPGQDKSERAGGSE